ncbi:hypothetical protein HBI65_167800 [Parastagonospora nodorum]|nr:hypothetical protein HBH43_170970 [Parastagonospora nodorum]KAH4183708.1 hypothetical protein HBH42_203400 [Parastagonospora nodorum]KAH4202875.1 hypothetical protein HBI95_159150 [Parastagonospora nodorum]KAH5364085.1 hypothetical protein HBI33_186450 [Parastagonospora nodorum]KAH5469673.1 hypothetical protein HBI28_172010 [Parastagonospora nodorum]
MTSQIAASNILSLRFHTEELDNNRKFQLNRERRLYLGSIVITTFEAERSVTLFCNGLTKTRLNLLEALRSGLLELTESHRQISIGVSADTTNAIWKRMLQPGQTYGLRLSKNNGKIVAYYTDEFSDRPKNAQKLRIGREGGTYYFTVHDDPAPPRLFARLSMPHQAHLTGPIPFMFTIEYTTDSPSPLVLDKSRSPLSVFSEDLKSLDSLIDCRDKITAFPDNDDFVEISVDKPWRFECTLENLENDYEYVRSMEGLEAEKTYTARIAGRALGPFSRWQYGRKGDLLEGTLEERIRRWELDTDKLGSLEVEMVGEDVEFVAVA